MATLSETTAEITRQLTAHLQALTGPRDPYLNSGRHSLCQQYLRSELGKSGTVTRQALKSRDRDYANWQTHIVGTRPKLAPILVGAHFDTVPGSPGADDNASGLAVLLMLAQLLSACPPRRTVHFVAFDLEEYGLVGSTTCAQAWRDANQSLHLMLSLEMLGYFSSQPNSQKYPLDLLGKLYPSTGDFIALIGNGPTVLTMMGLKKKLKQAGASCQWLPVVNQGRMIPAVRRSDHAPFWDAGYPAILVTDTADLRNPHYHRASDRIETLDISAMARVTQGLASGLRRL